MSKTLLCHQEIYSAHSDVVKLLQLTSSDCVPLLHNVGMSFVRIETLLLNRNIIFSVINKYETELALAYTSVSTLQHCQLFF